jgi:hypothetical protein
VTRDRILSSVLLPAPFGPIIPSADPHGTSIDTSRRAQNSASSCSRAVRLPAIARMRSAIASRRVW